MARTSVSRQPPGIDQAALTEFIADGHLERHIRATLQIYRERYETFVSAIQQYAAGVFELSVNGGVGMYLVAWLPRVARCRGLVVSKVTRVQPCVRIPTSAAASSAGATPDPCEPEWRPHFRSLYLPSYAATSSAAEDAEKTE